MFSLIVAVAWLIMGFITSVLARISPLVKDLKLVEAWVIACAALWPISLPILLIHFSFSSLPKRVIARINRNADRENS